MIIVTAVLCLGWGAFGGFIFGHKNGVADALRSVALRQPSTLKQIEVIKLKIKQKKELEQLEKGEVR
jgi:hypothetical protein